MTLTSPAGTIETTTQTYTWEADSCSTWYKLWIGYSGGGRVFTQWYESTEICSDGNCSITLDFELGNTGYDWYVKSWNEDGSVWNDGQSFTVTVDGNGSPAESADSSTFTHETSDSDNSITFSWTAVENATGYSIWIGDENGNEVYSADIEDSEVNSGDGYCSLTIEEELPDGSYTFYIQTWNDYGTGEWSDGYELTITNDEETEDDYESLSGNWKVLISGYSDSIYYAEVTLYSDGTLYYREYLYESLLYSGYGTWSYIESESEATGYLQATADSDFASSYITGTLDSFTVEGSYSGVDVTYQWIRQN